MHNVVIPVYLYSELSSKAKEEARQWWIDAMDPSDYADSVIEDAYQLGSLMGIEIKQREFRTMGGGVRHEPCVWWSGFSCQGDGASFEGRYQPKADNVARVREYAPQDAVLHAIARCLDEAFKLAGTTTYCTITTRGRYSHSGTMEFEFDWCDDSVSEKDFEEAQKLVVEACRNFADWIYAQLEKEYEYQCSEEAVTEMMESNEYTFTEDGRRFG